MDQIESLTFNLSDKTTSIPSEKTAELVNQLYEISESECISPNEVPLYVKQKIVGKQRTEQEIQKLGAILEERNIDIQTIHEFKKLEGELEKYGLSIESPRKLVSILSKINQMDYDPLKIVKELARLKIAQTPLKQMTKNRFSIRLISILPRIMFLSNRTICSPREEVLN